MKIYTKQKTILETTASCLYKAADQTAIEAVAKLQKDRPEIYAKALNLQRVLGVGGLWRGTYIALWAIAQDMLDVERNAKKGATNG